MPSLTWLPCTSLHKPCQTGTKTGQDKGKREEGRKAALTRGSWLLPPKPFLLDGMLSGTASSAATAAAWNEHQAGHEKSSTALQLLDTLPGGFSLEGVGRFQAEKVTPTNIIQPNHHLRRTAPWALHPEDSRLLPAL